MDDLESNPLYKAFLTKFKREFEIACKMSYLITIPHSDSLDNITIDQFLANSHILMPSKLLKMHYTPLQAGQVVDIEEIDFNKKLIVYLGSKNNSTTKIVVNILAQEIGYNIYNKEFRTILIDRPLIERNFPRSFIKSIFLSPILNTQNSITSYNNNGNYNISYNNNAYRRIRPPKPFLDHNDCIKYLEEISQNVTVELENDVKKLQSKYMFLSHYLDDAALRIKSLAELYLPKYEYQLITNFNNENKINNNRYNNNNDNELICDSLRKTIKLAIENYIVHLLHGKLITSLYQCHEKEDKILLKKFDLIEKYQLTICQLGAQEVFSNFCLTEEILQEFRRLPLLQSPLAMVKLLIKIVQLITDSLNQSVRFKNMIERGGGGGVTDLKEKKSNSFNDINKINNLDLLFNNSSCNISNNNDNSIITNTINQQDDNVIDDIIDKVSICSDDLIASFVYSLAQSKPPNLFSASKYLELFGLSSNDKEQAAYYTATFQIVIQYISSFNPEQLRQQQNREEKEDQQQLINKYSNFNDNNAGDEKRENDDDEDNKEKLYCDYVNSSDSSGCSQLRNSTSNQSLLLTDSLESSYKQD